MKDIFIDNNVAKNFVNPADNHYKDLIKWLLLFNEEDNEDDRLSKYAHLVVSNSLLKEYLDSSKNCSKPSSIPIIINTLTMQGRLAKFENKDIKSFIEKKFSKTVCKKLLSNTKDHSHIAIILMSNRKYAITIDDNLKKDLENFPGFNVTVSKRPENINYSE